MKSQHVERPWGSYKVLEDSDSFKVKHLVIRPKQRISYQYHMKRTEHWYVVDGIAEVMLEDKIHVLPPLHSVEIPSGNKHTVFNSGNKDLHIIEVQTGTYFGEDDIIRLNDIYGRE